MTFSTFLCQAWDADAGTNGEIRYFLSGQTDHFRMNPSTGDIRVNLDLNQEGGKSFLLKVEARDSKGSGRGLFSTIDVMVQQRHFFVNAFLLILIFYSDSCRRRPSSAQDGAQQ